MSTRSAPLPPGSTIGILGGGQLGRMTALAAAPLGYRCHIYCPQAGEPATQVCDRATIAAYDDAEALAAFAQAVDVVTYEFENVPAATAEVLARNVLLRPRPEALAICQDRLKEKDFLRSIGIATAAYAPAADTRALGRAVAEIGRPAILKSVRMGYDGKGQVPLRSGTDLGEAWAEMAGSIPEASGIVERRVEFLLEISVVVARGVDGDIAAYVPVENRHENHILAQTIAPAPISTKLRDEADAVAREIVEALDFVGVMGVEMFVTEDGHILVNELAPRPHNSGHWTLDACATSQFEQHVRAVVGLPLGDCERHSDAAMENLIGNDVDAWQELAGEPRAHLHLYGKDAPRPGRKMGHVTRLFARGTAVRDEESESSEELD